MYAIRIVSIVSTRVSKWVGWVTGQMGSDQKSQNGPVRVDLGYILALADQMIQMKKSW